MRLSDPPSDQLLRDLIWAIESPSFVDGPDVAGHSRVDAAMVDTDARSSFIASRASHRVGRYFESLLLFWLEQVRGVEVVGSAIQIRDGNRTVGELDFLFRDEAGLLNHWEVAVKFFLHHPDRDGSHFPGPNSTDDFERKATKLFDQQLPLSNLHYPDVSVRQAFVKGRAFYHPVFGEPDTLPDRMAAPHLRGWWFRASELALIEQSWEGRVATVAEKPYWLASMECRDGAEPLAVGAVVARLDRHFKTSRRPLMISMRDAEDNHEIDRVCVVATSWDTPPAGT